MNTPRHQVTYPRFLAQVLDRATDGHWPFYVWMTVLTAVMLVGVNAWAQQVVHGMGVTGMSDHVSWGLYIANFTFSVGLAAGGVMMVIPAAEINPDQAYLSNRIRPQGVVEKCTFCLHRTREGRLPACLEACPTGARVFGNVLDPDSDIRWVLENKRVFVLKEELGTQPRFFYFFDV